ncbi:MAG: hypothetical protein ACFFC1_16415 [Promethearchaeota archaeon]
MNQLKRIVVSVIFGIIAGFICFIGALLLGLPIDVLRFIVILVNRTLIGFVIGISRLRMNWVLHGILIGEVVGLPFFLYDITMGVDLIIVIGVLFINALFGIMIEFFTTVVFKLPVET